MGALVVSLALLSGFQTFVLTRLAEETPHVSVVPAGRDAFSAAEGLEAKLSALGGVTGTTPVVRGRAWITARGQAVPVRFAGRDLTTGLVLDPSHARPLGAVTGDEVNVVSSRTRLSPLGPVPIVASMAIARIVPSAAGRRQPEAGLPIAEARRLLGLPQGSASAYEVKLRDPAGSDAVAEQVRRLLGDGVTVTTWQDANRPLVLALRLERIVLFATVFLIVLVAGLNLAATSAVLVATRRADAAVLSVLGAPPKMVASVFRLAGLLLGAAGTLAGVLLGAAVSIGLDRTAAIPLPTELFTLSHVPFRVAPADVAAVTLFSVAWSLLAASLPARMAARAEPAEVLRAA